MISHFITYSTSFNDMLQILVILFCKFFKDQMSTMIMGLIETPCLWILDSLYSLWHQPDFCFVIFFKDVIGSLMVLLNAKSSRNCGCGVKWLNLYIIDIWFQLFDFSRSRWCLIISALFSTLFSTSNCWCFAKLPTVLLVSRDLGSLFLI